MVKDEAEAEGVVAASFVGRAVESVERAVGGGDVIMIDTVQLGKRTPNDLTQYSISYGIW